MSRKRTFDWAAAAQLRTEGMTYEQIGRALGVSSMAVWFALNDDGRKRAAKASVLWILNGACPQCGDRATRKSKAKQSLCRRCSDDRQREAALQERTNDLGQVHCARCDEHRSIGFFRLNRWGHPFIHCRDCESALRQERRLRVAAQ